MSPKPMSIGYVKQVREQVNHAVREAKDRDAKYTPIFWTGSHLNPVRIALILSSKHGKG